MPRGRSEHAAAARAVKAALPATLAPQLATLVSRPPVGDGWIYEAKLDGYRLLARVDGDEVHLYTRRGNDWTLQLKNLRDEIRAIGLASAWIDGEIVVLNSRSTPDFQLLQRAFDESRVGSIVYFAFDALYLNGYDLRRLPLVQRRELLKAALGPLKKSGRIRFSETLEGSVRELLERACKAGAEGLIGKRKDSTYTSARSAAWIKLKCTRRQEFVVVGYTDPKGSRVGFGSLLLAVHDPAGRLVYAGRVGTGFDQHLLASIEARLAALSIRTSSLASTPSGVKGHWVRPVLVAEVSFGEWTSDGRIRHPVFHGLRIDKGAAAITREREQAPEHLPRKPAPSRLAIKVTHGDRVIDPQSGATKLDLVAYYQAAAKRMLRHLEDRPISMVRAPTGVDGEHFFQKHGENIPGLRQLAREFRPGHPPMLAVVDAESLVSAAQQNVIEFHTWNSTIADITHPDRVIFDLDPGAGVDWDSVRTAAQVTHGMLDLLGLKSFLKTSGGKGLHVVVPIKPKWSYDEVKDFSRALVEHLASTLPRMFVAKSGAQNRRGRIFVDYLRNSRTATTIAAYSARARPGLGVSMPVAWKELPSIQSADQWTIHNAVERFRSDPWKGYWHVLQTLDDAARRLSAARR